MWRCYVVIVKTDGKIMLWRAYIHYLSPSPSHVRHLEPAFHGLTKMSNGQNHGNRHWRQRAYRPCPTPTHAPHETTSMQWLRG